MSTGKLGAGFTLTLNVAGWPTRKRIQRFCKNGHLCKEDFYKEMCITVVYDKKEDHCTKENDYSKRNAEISPKNRAGQSAPDKVIWISF